MIVRFGSIKSIIVIAGEGSRRPENETFVDVCEGLEVFNKLSATRVYHDI